MPPKDLQDLFLKGHFGWEGRKQRRFDELVMKLKNQQFLNWIVQFVLMQFQIQHLENNGVYY